MALRDTWHKTLVYFGLAEPEEGYADEPEPEPERELEERYHERPNVRRLQTRRRRDEIDDIFADEAPRSSTRQTRVLRPVVIRRLRIGPVVEVPLAPPRRESADVRPLGIGPLKLLVGDVAVLVPVVLLGDAEVDERPVPDIGEAHLARNVTPGEG